MALNAYLRLTGETQGDIEGSVTQAGKEGSILVVAFRHEVVSPVDPASGQPGKRHHKVIHITKEIDKSSVPLMSAWVHREGITEWELRFWRPSPSGEEHQFYTVSLMGGHIVSIEQEMLDNTYPENVSHLEREQIAFSYEKIVWTWEDGGTTCEDSWH